MAIKLDISYLGAGKLTRAWGRAALAISDLRPIWRTIRQWVYDSEEEIFSSQGRAALQRWPALGAWTDDPPGRYGRWKMRRHPALPLLVLSGALVNAATGTGSHSYYQESQSAMAVGINDLPYVKTMNFGFSPNNIPARRFIAPPGVEGVKKLDKRIQQVCNKISREINRAAAEAAGFAGGMAR
jgi:hypothetical protein